MNRLKKITMLSILALSASMKANYHILFINDFKTHDIVGKVILLTGRQLSKTIKPGGVGYFEFENSMPIDKITFKKMGGFQEPEYEKKIKYFSRNVLILMRPYSKNMFNYYKFEEIENKRLLKELKFIDTTIKRAIEQGVILKKDKLKAYIKKLEDFNKKYNKVLFGEIKFAWIKNELGKKLEKIEVREKAKEMEEEEFEILEIEKDEKE